MGHNRRYRCVGDAYRYGADFVVKCRRCGREEVFAQASFIEMMAVLGLGSDPERIGRKLRCTACRYRGAIVELAAPNLPGRLSLAKGDALPPSGVSITRWCKMGDGDRRRYRRALR